MASQTALPNVPVPDIISETFCIRYSVASTGHPWLPDCSAARSWRQGSSLLRISRLDSFFYCLNPSAFDGQEDTPISAVIHFHGVEEKEERLVKAGTWMVRLG